MDLTRFDDVVRRALAEDLGDAGDLTTEACVPAEVRSRASIVARRPGTVAGLSLAESTFRIVDPATSFAAHVDDGTAVEAGTVLATVDGRSRALLTAERTALNLLGWLSGIATATAALVRQVEGTRARITDTRKTTPTLRALEKYAVRTGGGTNHRFGLHDAVLIKDNHLLAAGGLAAAVGAARRTVGHTVKVEVEVDTLGQLDELLDLDPGADIVLLDNMDPPQLCEAVRRVNGRMITEASGGITAATVRAVAESGVDVISVGWITQSAPALDVGLDFAPSTPGPGGG
jgi:nicotinate-nucleotide pyrophosphorylase (carboxylating)